MFAGCPAPPAVWSSNTRSSINILRLVLSPLRRRELAPLAARLILPSQWGVGFSALLLGFSVAPKTLLPPVGQRPGFGAVFTSNYWRGGAGTLSESSVHPVSRCWFSLYSANTHLHTHTPSILLRVSSPTHAWMTADLSHQTWGDCVWASEIKLIIYVHQMYKATPSYATMLYVY